MSHFLQRYRIANSCESGIETALPIARMLRFRQHRIANSYESGIAFSRCPPKKFQQFPPTETKRQKISLYLRRHYYK
jgi:hypothetical protein